MIKKGFTLIELMVVVLIIMLLAGVIVVNVDTARKKARDAKRISDLSTVSAALENYYADNHAYPVADNWTIAHDSKDSPTGWVPSITPQYLQVLPVSPRNIDGNHAYWYRSDSPYREYKIVACSLESPEGWNQANNDGGTRQTCSAADHDTCSCGYEIFTSGSVAPGW